MTDDQLRDALARLDPAPRSVPPLSPELLERAMTTTTERTPDTAAGGPRRTPWLAAAAAAVVLAAAGGAYVLTSGSDPEPAGEPLELALPGGGPTMMSCLPVTEGVSALQAMTVAFAGTVTSVDASRVELSVERWYRGGDGADAVVLRNAPEQQQALLGATEFEVGEDYLVSAGEDRTVSVCGLSGPAEPTLQGVYDEAYGG